MKKIMIKVAVAVVTIAAGLFAINAHSSDTVNRRDGEWYTVTETDPLTGKARFSAYHEETKDWGFSYHCIGGDFLMRFGSERLIDIYAETVDRRVYLVPGSKPTKRLKRLTEVTTEAFERYSNRKTFYRKITKAHIEEMAMVKKMVFRWNGITRAQTLVVEFEDPQNTVRVMTTAYTTCGGK